MGDADFSEGLSDTLGDSEKENLIKLVFSDGYKQFVNKSEKLDAAIDELTRFMSLLNDMGSKTQK